MQEFVCTGHCDPIVRCPGDEDITIGVDCHALGVAPGAAPCSVPILASFSLDQMTTATALEAM